MRVEQIWERIIVRSGQYILNKNKIELDVDNFKVLVEDALAIYNQSRPFDKEYTITLDATRHFTFTETYDPELKQIPAALAEVTPVRAFASNPLLYGATLSYGNSQSSELIDPLQAPWVYKKPKLHVSLSSVYKVVAIFDHKIVEYEDPDDAQRTITDVPTISVNEDPHFFKLLQAMFLMGIGRSRRAFTLSDIPITMDADQLYSEGAEMEATATEMIHNNKKIHLFLR